MKSCCASWQRKIAVAIGGVSLWASGMVVQGAPTQWTALYDRGQPTATYVVGDTLDYQFEFAINTDTTGWGVEYGLGKTQDGTDWSWRGADWSRMDGDDNRVWISKPYEHQFTSAGIWYCAGRFINGGDTYYAATDWTANSGEALTAESYFQVNELEPPYYAWGDRSPSYPATRAVLFWAPIAGKNMLITVAGENWPEGGPEQGTAYSAGQTFGNQTVVAGSQSGGELEVPGLEPDHVYNFVLYTENNSYYSAGQMVTVFTGRPQARNTGGGAPEAPAEIFLGDAGLPFGLDSWGTLDGKSGRACMWMSQGEGGEHVVWGNWTDFTDAEHKALASGVFNATGTWHWCVQLDYIGSDMLGDAWWYLNGSSDWADLERYGDVTQSGLTVNVLPINDPAEIFAAPGYENPCSQIDVSWLRNVQNNPVMVVRKLPADSWTEPAQGTIYEVGDNLGSGTVVYSDPWNWQNGCVVTGLAAGTTYDFKFYSVNNSSMDHYMPGYDDPVGLYYSPGVTAQVSTAAEGPVISGCNNIQVVSADGFDVTVFYDIIVSDIADPDPTVVIEPPSGSLLPMGDTLVTVTAWNAFGVTNTCEFTVTVVPDTVAPAIDGCSNHVVTASNSFGRAVAYSWLTISDNADPNPTVVCDPPSGSFFPIGDTPVSIIAWDMTGHTNTCEFTMTVLPDTVAPAINGCSNQTVTASNPAGRAVAYTWLTVNDAADPHPTAIFDPPSGTLFPFGETPVTVTAWDASGNTNTCGFTMTVLPDTEAPIINGCGDHAMPAYNPAGRTVSYTWLTVNDAADPSPTVVFDPPAGTLLPLGETPVTVTAWDASGNTNTCQFTLTLSIPTIAVWGDNENGQCDVPAGLTNVTAIAAGAWHNVALRGDGTVAVWGATRIDFDQCHVPAGLSNVVAIAGGTFHTLALRSNGTVVAWGRNVTGQCNVPAGLSGVREVSAGYGESFALRTNGTVVAWGANPVGQYPVPTGLSNVVKIAAGSYHTLALKADGTVVAWGLNSYGQCNIPTGLSNVVEITAGYEHSLALKSDGTVVAWGFNNYGQCNVPTGLVGVVKINTEDYHNLALKSDGTVVAWGRNTDGQCTLPEGLTNVVDIAGGFLSSMALLNVSNPETPPAVPEADAATDVTTASFSANWSVAERATNYSLDVSAGDTFASTVAGYDNLPVGDVTTWPVTGLNPGQTYYYRVRAQNGVGTSANSDTIAVTLNKADQIIDFPAIGDKQTADVVELLATASSGLPVGFAVGAGPASISGGSNLTFTGTGTVSVVASQAGNGTYNPAPDVIQTFNVMPPPLAPVISQTNVNVREGGEGRFFVRLNRDPGRNVAVAVARTGGDGSVTIQSGAVRTFNSSCWNDWQAVTLIAPQDENATGETASFTVSMTGASDQTLAATVLDDDLAENLALATAGATIKGTKASQVGQLIDGVHASSTNYGYTIWTNRMSPGTITLDLKTTATVTRIRLLNWDWVYRVHRYQVESSLDGVNWALLLDASATDRHGWDDWNAGGQAMRYLRFVGLSNSLNQCVLISELEVYGTRPQTVTAQPVLLKTNVYVREGGEGRAFIRLDKAPVRAVAVSVNRTAGSDRVSVRSGAVLTFDASCWNVWQGVTLEAATDTNSVEETATFTISLAGAPDQILTATMLEDDIGDNLALAAAGTTATKSGGSLAGALIDGVYNVSTNYGYTIWTNNPKGTITLDLKANTAVTRIRLLNWDWVYRAHRYLVESSTDGTHWTTLLDATGEEHTGWDNWTVNNQVLRYLRFTGVSNTYNQCVLISELEVYGTRESTLPQPVLLKTAVNVREGGEGRLFVKLNKAPDRGVAVNFSRSAGDSSLTIQSGSVRTFDPTCWDTWQAVTLAAPQDANAAGETATFVVSMAGAADQYVTATALDDDIAENLALATSGATATKARGSQPGALIDGAHTLNSNYGYTIWTNLAAPGSITVDLKATATVARVRLLNWDWVYRVHRYRIESSVDGSTWSLLVDASGEDHAGWDDWPVANQAVRYLRFTGLYSSYNQCVLVSELEVYGTRPVARRALKGSAIAESEPVSVLTSEGTADETGWAAVDGDEATAWTGQKAGGGYLVIEYEPALTLSALEVVMVKDSLTDVQYLYSTDAENWQPLPEDLEGNPISLNYLWLLFPDDGTAAVPQVLEVVPNP